MTKSSTEMHPDELGRLQRTRKAMLAVSALAGLILIALAHSWWDHAAHRYIETFGTLLIVICILGRTLCAIYLSGSKGARIIDAGPYSICRNPLYVFSMLGAVGIGATSGSIVVASLFGLVVWTIQSVAVAKEEQFLLSRYGAIYKSYLDRVPRFWPDFSLWQSEQAILVRPRNVLRTFADATLFLFAIPMIEVFEYGKESGWLPAILKLP